jgi:hypothetical protein
VSQTARAWLQPALYIRNGRYPDAFMQTEMSELGNHLALYRVKELCSFGMTFPGVLASPGLDDRIRWRSRYHPSPYAYGVAVYGYLALTELETDELGNILGDPYALIEVTDDDPGTLSLGETSGGFAELHYGTATAEDSSPDACSAMFTALRDNEDPTTDFVPLQGRSYNVTITDVQSRLVAASVFETDRNRPAPYTSGFAVKGPIKTNDRGGVLGGSRKMFKRQAAKLFDWSVDDQASPRSISTGVSTNIIDGTSTTVSGATPGFTIDLRNRARSSTGTVTCRFSVHAACTDSGEVDLKDSTGTIVATALVASTTPAWIEVDVELPETRAKYDFQAFSPIDEPLTVYAVRLSQHDDGD